MSYRIPIIVLLAVLTSACTPYYAGGGYSRSQYYSGERYGYPGYQRYERDYYVVPQPRYYYQPAPRYYRPAPAPHYRPQPHPGMNHQWYGNPRNDYGNRQRYEYRRDRERHDYRNDDRRSQEGRWHSRGHGDRDRRPDGGRDDRNRHR